MTVNRNQGIGTASVLSIEMAQELWNKILDLEETYLCAMIIQPPPCICPAVTG